MSNHRQFVAYSVRLVLLYPLSVYLCGSLLVMMMMMTPILSSENALDTSSLLIVDTSTFSLLLQRFPSIFDKIRRQIFVHVTSTFFDAEAAEIPCHLAAFLVTNICMAQPEQG